MTEPTAQPTEFLWLELTGRCQLACVHCYAGSGPQGAPGTLRSEDWTRLIDESAGIGVRSVQFIGGEVTLRPDLPVLIRAAIAAGLRVEVFTNLVHVTAAQWEAFALPGVSLATSWYTADRRQHAAITGRDSYRQTQANIAEALRRSIPLRVGIIDGIVPDQRAGQAGEGLKALGVTDLGFDYYREFGRGAAANPAQTCGGCGRGRAAILPDGTVTPCPMSRWLAVGNVLASRLGTLLGEPLAAAAGQLPSARRAGAARGEGACQPRCIPDSYCNPLCSPGACKPRTK